MPKERKIEAVLFDLDGTLIFHDQSQFLSEYFKSIAAYTAARGYDAKAFLEAMRVSTGVMIANDGACTNESIFWDKFFIYYGKYDKQLIEDCDNFYLSEFKELRNFIRVNEFAKRAVELAHYIIDTKDTVRGYYNGAISEKTIDCLSKWYADMFKLNIISIQHKLEIKLKKQALKDYSFKAFLLCPLIVYSIPQYRNEGV